VALALALAWGAPATAVIIASGDGTGNTSAPPDDPGWGNVLRLGGLSGVYLGNGWVLTAEHVGGSDIIISGVVYEWAPGSDVQLVTNGPDPDADLLLFQIVRDPGLPDVLIRASSPVAFPPSQASEVVMIGLGKNRGLETEACGTSGWLWAAGKTMRWGTNVVHENDFDLAVSGTLTRAFSTLFNAGLPTPEEAQGVGVGARGHHDGEILVRGLPACRIRALR
jgi:hypothetical protein